MAKKILDNGWAFNVNDMLLSSPVKVTGKNVYCVVIPNIYRDGSNTFDAFDESIPEANFFVAALQQWLTVLDILKRRMNSEGSGVPLNPVQVYLECCRSAEDPGKIAQHRLYIVESAENVDLAAYYYEVWTNTDKPINAKGNFHETTARDGGGAGLNIGTSFTLYEMFRRINNRHSMGLLYDVLRDESGFTDNSKRLEFDGPYTSPNNPLHPKNAFSLDIAFRLGRGAVHSLQSRVQAYAGRGTGPSGGKVQLVLDNYSMCFKIPPHYWGVKQFMTRLFPFNQRSVVDEAWRTRMASFEKAIYSMQQAQGSRDADSPTGSRGASPVGGSQLFGGDDTRDSFGGEFDVQKEYRKSTEGRRARANGAQSGTGRRVAEESDFSFGIRSMTKEELEEHRQLLWREDSKQGVSDDYLDDEVGAISRDMDADLHTIRELFKNDTAGLLRETNTLHAIYWQRLERGITGEKSNVSETQQKLNKVWHEEKLADKHFHLPITDSRLSPLENGLVNMTARFGMYSLVATHQMLCVFLFIALGGVFDTDLDVHNNLYIHGPNGGGKSFVTKVVLKHFLWDCVKVMMTESLLANTIDNNSSDVLEYNEDTNFAALAESAKAMADKCHSMATQVTSRRVLELQEDPSTGTKKRVRAVYTNLEIKTELAVSNLDHSGSMQRMVNAKNGGGADQATGHAFWSRFWPIAVECRDNAVRAISDFGATYDPRKEKEFRMDNIRFNCIRGWWSKAIRCGLKKYKMDVFDQMFPQYIAELRKIGLTTEDHRVEYKAKRFCRQLIIYELYLTHHCTISGKFYGKPFRLSQMAEWDPICHIHHVIITFSRFIDCYVPPALDFVIGCLRQRLLDSIVDKSDSVTFVSKNKKKRADLDRDTREMINSLARTRPGPAYVSSGVRNANPSAAPGDGAMDEDENEATPGQAAAKGGDQERLDGTWVQFRGDIKDLGHEISVESKAKGIAFSEACIMDALMKLFSLPVTSKHYYFEENTTLPIVDERSKEKYRGVGLKIVNNNVHVNYDILAPGAGDSASAQQQPGDGGEFDDTLLIGANTKYVNLVTNIPARFCYETTLPQRVLVFVPDARAPWIPKYVDLAPVPGKKLLVKNAQRLDRHEILSATGTVSHENMPHNSQAMFNSYNMDIDSIAIFRYYQEAAPGNTIPLDLMAKLHPMALRKRITSMMSEANKKGYGNPQTGRPYETIKYPEAAIAEVNQRRKLILDYQRHGTIPDYEVVLDALDSHKGGIDVSVEMQQSIHKGFSVMIDVLDADASGLDIPDLTARQLPALPAPVASLTIEERKAGFATDIIGKFAVIGGRHYTNGVLAPIRECREGFDRDEISGMHIPKVPTDAEGGDGQAYEEGQYLIVGDDGGGRPPDDDNLSANSLRDDRRNRDDRPDPLAPIEDFASAPWMTAALADIIANSDDEALVDGRSEEPDGFDFSIDRAPAGTKRGAGAIDPPDAEDGAQEVIRPKKRARTNSASSGSGSDSDSGSDSGFDSGSAAGSDADSDGESDGGSDGGSDAGSDDDSGAGSDAGDESD